ncbi:hypothetical protein [uncultured Acetatifactor sp.]|uniref:CIS tube protein n=2 Tax=uncultured Acetatifactor sp. TaxID=1671927 RepID=UPI0026207329|nr:hypothetical protein [uncultured Acetatifactor sp.]MCI8695184.1 hypothetical protein [Lachnospiraceae bacterium]
MNAVVQDAVSSLTGNLPKAILCVRDLSQAQGGEKGDAAKKASDLQKRLLKSTEDALNGLMEDNRGGSQTFRSLTGRNGVMAGSGYLALEVQYNPSSISMSTQAGKQVQYSGGSLGQGGANQITQIVQPVSTTMSFQLVFDDMNPQDAFVLENMAPTAGNLVSGTADVARKVRGAYSVQAQMDGLMSLLTQPVTRKVIFYWAKMCFQGELVSVSSRYTMFNKDGNPIRGMVDLTIRQGEESGFDVAYWDEAFTRTFGDPGTDQISGKMGMATKAMQNNLLNIHL